MKLFFKVKVFILIFFLQKSFAQTNTWTGAVDNDWHRACNWSLNQIPTCSHDVVIPNASNSPIITGIAHSKTINIQSSTGGHLQIVSSGGGILYISSLNNGVCSGTATDNSSSGCCVGWEQTYNLSPGGVNQVNSEKEEAYGITTDGTNLYIVGDYHGWKNPWPNSDWRIEKRLAVDGSFVTSFGTNGIATQDIGWIDVPFNIVYDATGIYVAGIQHSGAQYTAPQKWRIQKFNSGTGASIWTQTPTFGGSSATVNEYAYDIAVNSTGIYTAGHDANLGSANYQWRIMKHNSAGTQQWSVASNHTTGIDVAFGIAADETDVYVVGSAIPASGSDAQWIIEKRSAATGALVTGFGTNGVISYNPQVISGTADYAHDVAIDANAVYVVGLSNQTSPNYQYSLRKYDKTNGNLLWSITENVIGSTRDYRVAVDATGVYVAGNWGAWNLYKYDLSNGSLLCSKSSTTNNPAANNIISTSSGIFLVGKDNTAVNEQWRIEKMCCE